MLLNFKPAVLAVLLAIQGCATVVETTDGWPAHLPARLHFSRIYASDAANAAVQTEEQYLSWVRRFYEGSEFYAWGYLDLESLLLEDLKGDAAINMQRKLDAVGMQIGGEWAKDRRVKLITTRMLSVWGDAIQSAVSSGQPELVIDRISADVAAVLSGELPGDAIAPERYGNQFDLALVDACSDPSGATEDGC